MSDFDRNDRSGGDRGGRRFGGGRSFGRRSFGGGRDFGGRGDRMMHKATCANCGKECEVPFRPSGDRPVYCSDCFEKRSNEEGNPRRSEQRDFGRPRFDQRPSQFQSGSDKGNGNGQLNSQILDQLKSLNAKLDKIVSVLAPKAIETPKPAEKQKISVEPQSTQEKAKKPRASRKKPVPEKVEA